MTRRVRSVMRGRADRRGVLVAGVGSDPRACHLHQQFHRPLRVARHGVGVDAALETRARLATELQPLGAAGNAHRLEVGGFEQDLSGGFGDLGGGPAHDPGDGLRCALGVGDDEVFGRELALDAVKRGHALAVGREAHDDAAPTKPREIERVQRLVAFEQHVVGDVDHVADRAHTRLHQALCHPARRLPHRDLRDPAQVARAALGVFDRHRDVVGDRHVDGRVRLRDPEGQLEVRGQLARDADDAHRVGPIRGDRQLEDHVVETEDDAHVVAELTRGVELDDAAVVVAEAHLASRQQHAVGHLAADRAPLEREATRQRRARRRVRHHHAGGDVRGTTHDACLPAPEVDVGETDLVGIRMGQHIEDARRDHPADLAAGLFHCLHFEAELIERRHDLGHRRSDGREVADPGEGCPHQYCARNRTSSSKKVLISSMP